jgi:hypothetical protein
MANYDDVLEAQQALTNPNLPAADLPVIAQKYPQLQAAVVAHPAAYDGLLDWLDQWGGPDVKAAIAARRAPAAAPATPAPAEPEPAHAVPEAEPARAYADASAPSAPSVPVVTAPSVPVAEVPSTPSVPAAANPWEQPAQPVQQAPAQPANPWEQAQPAQPAQPAANPWDQQPAPQAYAPQQPAQPAYAPQQPAYQPEPPAQQGYAPQQPQGYADPYAAQPAYQPQQPAYPGQPDPYAQNAYAAQPQGYQAQQPAYAAQSYAPQGGYPQGPQGGYPAVPVQTKKSKTPLIIALAAVLVLAGAGIGSYFLFFKKDGVGESQSNGPTLSLAQYETLRTTLDNMGYDVSYYEWDDSYASTYARYIASSSCRQSAGLEVPMGRFSIWSGSPNPLYDWVEVIPFSTPDAAATAAQEFVCRGGDMGVSATITEESVVNGVHFYKVSYSDGSEVILADYGSIFFDLGESWMGNNYGTGETMSNFQSFIANTIKPVIDQVS